MQLIANTGLIAGDHRSEAVGGRIGKILLHENLRLRAVICLSSIRVINRRLVPKLFGK
jgi:hypothetical protein